MNLYTAIAGDIEPFAQAGRIYGVVVGIVTNNEDSEDQGRVKVKYPWLTSEEESPWARVAAPLAGKERGFLFLPEVGDEVLVVFEHGDITRPYILGGLWGGTDLPPTAAGNGRDKKVLKSKSGHIIRLDDTGGAEKIEIIGKDAKDSIVIDAAQNTITIVSDKTITLESGKDLLLKASNGKVSINAKEIEVVSDQDTTLTSGQDLTLKASSGKGSVSANEVEVMSTAASKYQASGDMTIKGSQVNIN